MIAGIGAGSAHADVQSDREARNLALAAQSADKDVPAEKPDPGREAAPLRAPAWCGDTTISQAMYENATAIGRQYHSGTQYSNTWPDLMTAAQITCRWPNEPAVQRVAQTIEQHWINMTGLSEADALETMKLHFHDKDLEADQKKLCDQLTVSDEAGGEDVQFNKARRLLFGCPMLAGGGVEMAQWTNGNHPSEELVPFLDNSATKPDPFVLLSWIVERSHPGVSSDPIQDRILVNYAVDQYDYSLLDAKAVRQMLETAPYQGNRWARATILESLGRAQMGIATIQAAVQKKASDPDWKNLLVTAPAAGIAAWKAEAAGHKDELARSDAYEHTFYGPSKNAMKGCWDALDKDFLVVAKKLPHGSQVEFQEALSQPVPSLLLRRLAACASVDKDPTFSGKLIAFTRDVRESRGPRVAAYYAALDALNKIRADRMKFPVALQDLNNNARGGLYDASLRFSADERNAGSTPGVNGRHHQKSGKQPPGYGPGYVGDGGKGIVASVKKTGDGVEVTFVHQSHQEMGRECHDTGQINTFRPDGSIMYRQSCHDTGLISVNTTPQSITVPAEQAGNIAAGTWVDFVAEIGKMPRALPIAVYSDKSKKKLVNWYGFAL